jgi:hypothetical protein
MTEHALKQIVMITPLRRVAVCACGWSSRIHATHSAAADAHHLHAEGEAAHG